MRTLVVIWLFAWSALAVEVGTDYGFPSYDHPRDGAKQDYYLQQAIIERYFACLAAGYVTLEDIADLIASWRKNSRSEYHTVVISKQAVKNIMTNFVNVEAIAEEGSVKDYLDAKTFTATVPEINGVGNLKRLVPYTINDMLVARGAPLNYFDYTFERSLKSAGHPVTITGITDVAFAGAHIPAGRDSWYTYDYGKNALWTIVTNLWYIQNINSVSTSKGVSEYGGRWFRKEAADNQLRVIDGASYTLYQLDYDGEGTNLISIGAIEDQTAQWAMIVSNILASVSSNDIALASEDDPCAYFLANPAAGNTHIYRAYYEVDSDLQDTNYLAFLDVVQAGEWNRTVNDWLTRVNVTSNTPPFTFDVFLWFEPTTTTNTVVLNDKLYEHPAYGVSNYLDYSFTTVYIHDDHGATDFDVEHAVWIGDMSSAAWTPGPGMAGWEVAYDDVYTATNVGGGASFRDAMTSPTGSAWNITGTTNCVWPDADTLYYSGDYYGWSLALGIYPPGESSGTIHKEGNRIITLMDFSAGYRWK